MTEYIIECEYDFDEGWMPGEQREEIVRCKDCKWCIDADTFYDCEHFACHLYWNEGQAPDGFCAWGERQEP